MDKQAAAALNEQQGKLGRSPDCRAARLNILLIPPSPAVDPSRVTCVINSVCSKQSRTSRLHQAAAALISGQLVILSKRVVLLSASIIATTFPLCQDKGNCSYKHLFLFDLILKQSMNTCISDAYLRCCFFLHHELIHKLWANMS